MEANPGAREQRFRELYDAHHDPVHRFIARRTSPALTEDVVADTFLVAWRRFDDVPTRAGETLPWLYTVARNCLLNARRGADRQQALAVRIGDALSATTDLDVDAIARRTDLAAAWRRLTPAEQEVLSLAIWEDLPSPQAARVLGTSAAAFRLRLTRARRALRGHLDPTDTRAHPVSPSFEESTP